MSEVLEINVLTGERTERDFTADELAHREALQAAEEAKAQAAVEREAAKASALAKLEALGLTQAEAQAIAGI